MSDIRSDGFEILHYNNPEFPVLIARNVIPPNCCFSDMTLHWHDELEFIYVISGDIGYFVDGEHIVMKAGEGIFVNSRHMHLICNEKSGCTLFCLIFPPTILCSAEYVASKMVMPILNAKDLPYLLLSENVTWQKAILDSVSSIWTYSEMANHESEAVSAIYYLWGKLYRNLETEPQEGIRNENLSLIKKMLDYIFVNYNHKVTLNDICVSAGIGKNKCTELFRKYTNMSPVEYLRHYRVEKGVELLKNSDMSVTEIAYEVGMSGASYFAESLKKCRGCSPSQIRKEKER